MNEQRYIKLNDGEAEITLAKLEALDAKIDSLFDHVRDETTLDTLNGKVSQVEIMTSMAKAKEWHTDYDGYLQETLDLVKALEKKHQAPSSEKSPKKPGK